MPLHHGVAASCAVVGGGCQREQAGAAVDDFSLPLLSKDRVPLSGRLGDRREAQDRARAHPRQRSSILLFSFFTCSRFDHCTLLKTAKSRASEPKVFARYTHIVEIGVLGLEMVQLSAPDPVLQGPRVQLQAEARALCCE